MASKENPVQFRQQLPDKEQLRSPESPKYAAAVAIVNWDNKVLLMKRVDYGNGHGQDWVYPGGAVDEGEVSRVAARREVFEEAGIVLEPERNILLPLANYITLPDAFGVKHDLMVYIARYYADQPEPYVASPDEMTNWGWFDPQEALDKEASGEMKILLSGKFAIQRVKEYLSDSKTRDYSEVLMGGTFDRLHEGHKQLLQRAFDVGDYVYIGLTTDMYIQGSRKTLKEKVESYDERLDNLRRYLDQQGVLNRTIIIPLEDTAGPKALDPKLGAIVVSEETQAGGQYVNDLRAKNGVKTMETVVVKLLRDQDGIVSSTRFRQKE